MKKTNCVNRFLILYRKVVVAILRVIARRTSCGADQTDSSSPDVGHFL